MQYKYKLSKIHCAGCALALEQILNEIEGVSAEINFVSKSLKLEIETENPADTLTNVKIAISKFDHQIELLDFEDEPKKKSENAERIIKVSRYSISVIFMVVALFFDIFWLKIMFFAFSYIVSAYDVLIGAILNLKGKNLFDEKFLMSVASIGAFAIGEYIEAICVMVLYGIGEIFENIAVEKSKRTIKQVLNIKQPYANLYDGENSEQVPLDRVKVGDVITIKPGERVPLDGKVINGTSYLDMSALTGEAKEKIVSIGDEVLSGSINGSSVLIVKVTKLEKDSTVSKIIEMVQNATETKAKSEKFISKFSRVYTPAVLILAVVIAIIPTIFLGFSTFSSFAYRALCFLVVSCPCALVISVPLSYFAGIGALAKNGVLVKGASFVESLAKVDDVIFDKTGTLTKGVFEISEIYVSKNHTEDEIIELAAYAENFSNHKIARSIKKAYNERFTKKKINLAWISDYEEIAGKGIKANIFMQETFVGNFKFLKENNINVLEVDKAGTVLYVATSGEFIGYIVIADSPKDDAASAIKALKELGIEDIALSTGDEKSAAKGLANKIGIEKYYSGLLPADKVSIIENEKLKNKIVAFVGDGINDAPSLATSDVGISMGGFGSDVAVESSDVVLMTDEPSKVAVAIKKSRRTHKIALQNIVFSISIKVAILALIGFGFTGMWLAVFADVGVSLLAVLNSLRALIK